MARFKIISKDGSVVRYEGKPRYNGSYLRPSYLEFSEIASPTPIVWEIGDYVDYPRTGMRYRLYSIPQASKNARKDSHGKAFTYSNVQLYSATKELEIALFRDIVDNDNNIHFSTAPDVATFEDVEGIARRVQACMDDLYPGRWEIRIADFDSVADVEVIDRIKVAKDFALSGGTCLDALSKIYELWEDIGWFHSYDAVSGKDIVTIGYANRRRNDNTTDAYLYGKGNGLTAIKKTQTNKDEFATRLYIYGSERNLPSRYYNGLDILNAESVDIRNLMLPLEKWGKTDGLPDANKAYLENAEAVAKFGVIPKVHYFDSVDSGADIYPSIEGMTIGHIRKYLPASDKYYPSVSAYPNDSQRVDEIRYAINPADSGELNQGALQSAISTFRGASSTVDVKLDYDSQYLAENILLFSHSFDFAQGKPCEVKVKPGIGGYITDAGFDAVKVTLTFRDNTTAGVYNPSKDVYAVKNENRWEFMLPEISYDYAKTALTTYNCYVYLSIQAYGSDDKTTSVSYSVEAGDANIGLYLIQDKTFTLRLHEIGFNIDDMAAKGNGKTISVKTGSCAGRNFEIVECRHKGGVLSSPGYWDVTCKRQQDDTLGLLFPNSSYEVKLGDKFVLVDIAMPESYINSAMDRLLAEGERLLARASKIQTHYEPSIDAKVMMESGRVLREGMFMQITDEDVVDNTTDYIIIDTLNIYEDESAIPTYKVSLRERRKVTYKGTPSATSTTETKAVEIDDEKQSTSSDGYWTIDARGNLVTKRNVIVEGDVASGSDTPGGNQPSPGPSNVGISAIRLNGTTYYDTDADGIIDLGTIQSGGGLTSVSWADIKDRPTTLSRFTNDMGFVTDASLGGIYDMVNDINDDIASLQTNKQDASTAINTGNIRNHAPSLTGEGATGNWNVRSAALYAPYKNSTTISEVAETLRYHATIPSSFASWCTGYNNAVLNISRHTDTGYSSQLGFSGGGMYYRHQNKGTWGEWKTVAFTDSTVANATKLDGKSLLVGTWNGIPTVAGGVMEIGRYIDFHHAADTGKDYTTRITAPVVDTPNNVTLPSTGGTLALLTSNVASATKLNTARKIWGQSFDGTKDINGDAVIDGNLVVKGDIASA